jgi:uncharacterized protein
MDSLREKTIQKRKIKEDSPSSGTRTKNKLARLAYTVLDSVCSIPIWAPLFKSCCQSVEINQQAFGLRDLPAIFNGYRMLFITDFHLEITPNALCNLDFSSFPPHDIVILGGDFFDRSESHDKGLLNRFLSGFTKPIYAVLGNHDSVSLLAMLEGFGVRVLLNESVSIERAGESFLLTGIDDVSQFNNGFQRDCVHQSAAEFSGCKVLISHSPDFLPTAAEQGYALQLSGHTHGGQFKIFNKVIFRQTKFDFATAGAWQHLDMMGFTSTGFGSSRFPIRNITPEIVLIELYTTT